MKASALRDIVFAHAIETAPPHEALPTAARCDAITQECLHALGKSGQNGKSGAPQRAAFTAFLQERALRVIAAAQLPAEIRALRAQAAGVSRWAVLGVLALAFAVGYAGHAITDPHRVDLLSPSLISVVLWNLLVYVLLVLNGLRGLLRRKPAVAVPLMPVQGVAAAPAASGPGGWLHKLQPKKMQLAGTGLRKMALTFERNWWQLSQRPRRAQWLMCLHLGAAMLAAGALASLWVTGLTRAYLVGWESTFLSPAAVQSCLNLLFEPVHHLLGTAPWSLEEIRALQGWASAGGVAQAPLMEGERWVQRYTLLLALTVLAPRLLLALGQALRARWLAGHMALPLQQPYFQKLQRDWAGRATVLQVLPYSLEITPPRQAGLQRHVAQRYGAGAQLVLLPTLAYGGALPASAATSEGAQQVLLLNMVATPEAEIHGQLLAQVQQRWGVHAEVWLWAADFVARNSGAPSRVREREHLWQEFVRQHARDGGLTAQVITGEEARP